MMMFDVAFTVSIPGIPTFNVVRTVTATTMKEAIALGEQAICVVVPQSVTVNLTGVPVLTDPTAVVKPK